MGTLHKDIYDRALFKMREYVYINMENEQVYNMLSVFLKGAESEFARVCDISIAETMIDSDGNTGYLNTLPDECIEILALGIVYYWSTAYVADSDKWRLLMGTRDFSVSSPANLLAVTRDTRDNFGLEFRDKINRYSYIHGDLIREQVKGR